MGHIKVKNKTRKYMSVFGTFVVIGLCLFIGFLIGFFVGQAV